MATWAEFSANLRASGSAKSFGDDNFWELTIPVNGGRSQTVRVSRWVQADGEWVRLDSPFTPYSPGVDVLKYLRAVAQMPCGGLEILSIGGDEALAVRHVVPLATMDNEDFFKPLVAAARVADAMEHDVHGVDIF